MIIKEFFSYIKDIIKNKKLIAYVMGLYLLFHLSTILYFIIIKQNKNLLIPIILMFIPLLILMLEKILKLTFPPLLILGFLMLTSLITFSKSYNIYTNIPNICTFIQILSGIMFACLGFNIAQLFLYDLSIKKNFIFCLMVGVLFSLSVGFLTELLEYAYSIVFDIDVHTDSIINTINSPYLERSNLENISHSIIFYGKNKHILIEGGYLDIGLYDLLNDMILCLLGSLIYLVALPFSKLKFPKIYNSLSETRLIQSYSHK